MGRHYFENIDALIFVVDTNDKERIHIAQEELHRLMGEPALLEATLLPGRPPISLTLAGT